MENALLESAVELFQGDKDEGVDDKTEQRIVEAKIVIQIEGGIDLHPGPAEHHCNANNEHPGDAKNLAMPTDKIFVNK